MQIRKSFLLLFILVLPWQLSAQSLLMDMVDTTTQLGKGIFAMYQNYSTLRFSGYMQPQFQIVEGAGGVESYAGGDFPTNVNNRFMLRRGRIRLDYTHYNKDHLSTTNFVFQFDGTERGVNIRDFWGRFFENKWQLFAVTTGMFARPFGNEVNLSSANRETPERGRMSQILMKTERDLGVMLTFNRRKEKAGLRWLKADIGIFNGQGLTGSVEYDNKKDIIGRISAKPIKMKPLGMEISGGVSVMEGAIINRTPMLYSMNNINGVQQYYSDSVSGNINKKTARQYYGADVQLKIPNRKGTTELRAEYITGMQPGSATTSQTPGTYPIDKASAPLPLYHRSFNGAYFYLLQHLGTENLQAVLKYDWYDPNSNVSGKQIDVAGGMGAADIRYDTFGLGGIWYINPHMKLFLWYDMVTNETTSLKGYDKDIMDNVLTVRIQYSF